MNVLNKKILRDIIKNKSQFITIFIMVFLAIFAFCGVHSYMDGMVESSKVYYKNQNLQDLWVISKDIKTENINQIKNIENVNDVERLITLDGNVIDSKKYTNPDSNQPLDDLVLECNFIETNNINKMYVIEGEEYSKDKSGLWLDYYLANKIGIKLGEELEISIEGTNFKEKVVGLVEVPDHVYFMKDDTAIFPTHTDYGFAYLSINEFPKEYIYNKIFESDEIQEGINDLKDLRKNFLERFNKTEINDQMLDLMENLIDYNKNINIRSAMSLLDDAEEHKEEFIKAVKPDFNIEDYIIYPYAIVDVKDESNINDTKKEIKNIENVVTVTTRNENVSYDGYKREAEEGETYSGLFSGLFVLIAILSVVTTMNRFVRKERTQIGTLKALGVKKYKITWMYVCYGLFISIIAGALGIVLGKMIIGKFFLTMEMKYYEIPYYQVAVLPIVYEVTIGIIVLITLITYLSCRKVLKEPAAEALRVERPKIKTKENNIWDKKIFKNLSLSTKWNLRDIARSKGRTLMALFGIAGCTVLVVVAFGMLDSMNGYMSWEFDTINNFEYKLNLSSDYTESQYNSIIEKYGDNTSQTLAVEIKNGDDYVAKTFTINDAEDMLVVTNHNREKVTLKDDGIYVTEKMASIYGLKVGDEIKWHIIGQDNIHTSKIARLKS